MAIEAPDVLKPWLVSDEGGGEWRGFCINCEDPKRSKTPSAGYNLVKGVWHCMGKCDARGSIPTLVRKIKSGELPAKSNVLKFPVKGGDSKKADNGVPMEDRIPLPDDSQLTRWTKQLLADDDRMKYLRVKRGIDDVELIKHLRLGYDRRRQRYTIPIFDEAGELANVRMYKPNAQGPNKMISWGKGWGNGRIYGHDTLSEFDTILLCEGEWDRIVALQNGLNAVTDTAGAKVFKPEWAKFFKGKNVYIAYDEDETGKRGAQRVRRVLEDVAESIYGVTLDLDVKGGDVTDFFLAGRVKDDMIERMGVAAKWYGREAERKVPTKGKPVSLTESQNPENGTIEVVTMIAGKSQSFAAPRKLVGICDQSAGAKCNTCYFAATDGQREKTFDKDDPVLLQFMGTAESIARTRLYPKMLDANCTNHVNIVATEEYAIEELLVTPSVEHRGDDAEPPIMRSVYSVGTYKTQANQLARIVGVQRPHPRDQSMVLHGWHYERVAQDIDTFNMTPAIMASLRRFRPKEGQTPLDKCYEIADDLAANVTHIYGRPQLHVGYDLVWHSATSFMFEGKAVTKGWLECLVIGDTRTGKSETAASLIKHYKSGVMRPLEGSSFAGLVGGAMNNNGAASWLVKWGLIPLNDRRLVVLDEMSGLFGVNGDKGILAEMSSIRSEGKAQITKMGHNETSARTRLIWISNPIDGHTTLSQSYDGCITAIQELVRNPEDIARFDFVMAAAQTDVESKVINSPRHKRVPHRHTTKFASDLVMWAWSRRADQIKFLNGTEALIYQKAESMGRRYVEDPPLLQRANARLKIARLAVAIAARTFSSDRTGEFIMVKKIHVRAAAQFLDDIYGHEAMGYRAHSDRIMRAAKQAEESVGAAREFLLSNGKAVRVLSILGSSPFKHHDFIEMGELDEDEARTLISKLTMWGMLKPFGRYNQKKSTPQLLRLLKELEG